MPNPAETEQPTLTAESAPHASADAVSLPHSPRPSSLRWSLAVLLVVWAISLVWLATHLNRGWVPYDDGALAQSAERVLQGQLPHRDFDEIYTGGLTYLHAGAFRLFGIKLTSLRMALFAFFALWIPAIYFIASRFAKPSAAGLVTLLAMAWSVPNYAASMPSWYNLFFATFGLAALLRYLEARTRRWLFIAGLCGGFSFLVKSPGLYFIGASLLFFLFQEQSEALDSTATSATPGKLYRTFLRVSVILFVAALAALIRRQAAFSVMYQFLLPGMTLGLVLLARESRNLATGDGARVRNLMRIAIPFLAGAVLPAVLFLIPYVAAHSVRSFYDGVFVLPLKRITMAAAAPPGLDALLDLIPLLAILIFAIYSKLRESLYVGSVVFAALIEMFVA